MFRPRSVSLWRDHIFLRLYPCAGEPDWSAGLGLCNIPAGLSSGGVVSPQQSAASIGFERLLSKLIVTPRMHGIHHSQVWRENNSNFGTVFTFWDRLHRTLGLNIPQSNHCWNSAYSLPNDNRSVPRY
jgi:hypothetical protein